MPDGFPIPRHVLPKVNVTREEHATCREFMDRMLRRVVDTYESFVDLEQRAVDAQRWKHMASRDDLNLYSKRKDRSNPLGDQYGPLSHFKHRLPPVDLLLTGKSPGTVEKTMHAVITPSQLDLALVVTYLHDDVLDCALLNTMEPPTEQDPFHYLGYKLFVRKSPVSSSLLRNRDSTYLEACGLVSLSSGEQIGYRILHTLDLVAFPPLMGHNCIRSKQSLAYLYRQKYDNVVEVFMIGSLDLGGHIIKPVAKKLIADTLFGITRLIKLFEIKSLTEMARRRQGFVALTTEDLTICILCEKKRRKFLGSSSSVGQCPTCGMPTCSRCRVKKRIFVGDGVMGRFVKIECCKTCVLVAKRGPSNVESSTTNSSSQTPSPVQLPERQRNQSAQFPGPKTEVSTLEDAVGSRARARTEQFILY